MSPPHEVSRPGDENTTEATSKPTPRTGCQDTPSRYSFWQLLDILGHFDDFPQCQVSVCWERPDRAAGSRPIPFAAQLSAAEDAPQFVERLVAETENTVNVWFGLNMIDSSVTSGRGTAKDVTRLAALPADIDVKPGACPDLATAHGVVDDLSVVLDERPAAIIYSGHGLQPIWLVDRESAQKLNNADSQKLGNRFGRLVADIGRLRGFKLDKVSDLARVLRVPDTMNVKDPVKPVPTWCAADSGTALTVEQISAALDDYALPEIDSDAAHTGAVISAPEGWTFGDTDCPYVVGMVVPWGEKSDEPSGGRHQWAMNRAVRLAAAHRLGCITESGLQASLEHLARCLEHWCDRVGNPRNLQPEEIDSAYRWAVEKVATFTDEQTAEQLGNHQHAEQLEDINRAETGLYTDVAGLLDGGLPEAPRPQILQRTDGVPLFYPGEVNNLFGDPETGKTWVGLAACAEVLWSGGRVLVADLDHNGASAIVSRLLLLGAPKEAVSDPDRFRHCAPTDKAQVLQVVADCVQWKSDVVLLDSIGELLPLFGASSDSGDDFTRVHNTVLQPLAATGATVVVVDHLAKNRDSRDIGPGGTMAKRRTVGGLSLRVVCERPYTKTDGGASRLLVNKDRHGGVRDHCPPPRRRDNNEQMAGTFVLVGCDQPTWRINPGTDPTSTEEEFRPTALMEKASRAIEAHSGEFTRDKTARETGGKKASTLLAIDLLVSEGFVSKSSDRYPKLTSVRPYRQSDDPQPDDLHLAERLRHHTDDADGG